MSRSPGASTNWVEGGRWRSRLGGDGRKRMTMNTNNVVAEKIGRALRGGVIAVEFYRDQLTSRERTRASDAPAPGRRGKLTEGMIVRVYELRLGKIHPAFRNASKKIAA
jgi:hypothetical protein